MTKLLSILLKFLYVYTLYCIGPYMAFYSLEVSVKQTQWSLRLWESSIWSPHETTVETEELSILCAVIGTKKALKAYLCIFVQLKKLKMENM